MKKESIVLNGEEISQKIKRLAWQIYEDNIEQKEIIIVGVCGRGEVLAAKLRDVISKISLIETKIGTISLDKEIPYQKEISINLDSIDYTNKVVLLVDDVLNSGKTLMYASKYFLTTPLIRLSTVVLVDRTHNRFPIKADYIGLSLATTLQNYITVILEGKRKGIYLS
tara:strand:+ start:1290 stop:1793 length:504 start_codon:yes stop_codon:yes gene_type:complete